MTETSVYLDTNVIVAVMEASPSEDSGIQNFWQQSLDQAGITFHTSELSLAELLVMPYRRDDHALVRDYLSLFSGRRGLTAHPASRTILDIAAVICSRRKTKLPDAIHLATASATNCPYFLTFDGGFSDLDSNNHPFFENIRLSPVKIARPDPSSLFDLIRTLS